MKFFSGGNNRPVQQKHPWYLGLIHQTQDAEVYWDQKISPNLSDDQKILFAEQLFCYVWSRIGSVEAIHQVVTPSQQLQLAKARFDKGCQLCNLQFFESALLEIEKSKLIQESYGVWCHEDMEIKVHYAKGVIMLGLGNYSKALAEFRRAWRISGLKLGPSHILTKSSILMVENVLSKQGCNQLEIHQNIIVLRQAILHEKEGDFFHVAGDLDLAIFEYRQSILEYQRHHDEPRVENTAIEQADIHSKIAKILELQGKQSLAEVEWAVSLSLFQSSLGSRHPKTIEAIAGYIRNHRPY